MALDLTGITNENEFYTHHYLTAILENDLKDLFKTWNQRHKEEGQPTPAMQLGRLAKPYFKFCHFWKSEKSPENRLAAEASFLQQLLDALGYHHVIAPSLAEVRDGE